MVWAVAISAEAQDLSALARLDAGASQISGNEGTLDLELAISQSVPWRVRMVDAPPRLILDVREVDWRGVDRLALPVSVAQIRAGVFRPGWSRLVVELAAPMRVSRSEMVTEGAGAKIRLQLQPTTPEDFAIEAARPVPAEWAAPKAADIAKPKVQGKGPVVIVLDPGHGGIDPGAEKDGQSEAKLMLTFARELKEALLRDGRFKVVLTRDDDVFVPLEARISIARAAGADVFLSLHADALAEGEAQGATVYTLAEDATDEAAQALAERHDRDDLLAGIDLSAQDDLVVTVLMDMARTETQPRTDRLAGHLVAGIKGADLRMHRHPHQEGGFSVLKSPEIPSALVEVGFLSSARDLKRLEDPKWRAQFSAALVAALSAWAVEDQALRAMKGN